MVSFSNDLKSRKVFVFQYFPMVWDHQKPLISQSFFHWFFMFFQNRSQGQFLEGPGADLYRKIEFGCNFRFSELQKGIHWMTFSTKTRPKCTRQSSRRRPYRDPAFHETTVIAVPLGPSVFKTSLFRWRLAKFQFFLFFFVLGFICHLYYICW